MTTLAPLKLLLSQKPDSEKVYLLLSLALLDFSGEDLVSEDATDSKFPVRPLWTVEKNCFILLCYLMKHYWCTVHAKKNLHVSSWVRTQRKTIWAQKIWYWINVSCWLLLGDLIWNLGTSGNYPSVQHHWDTYILSLPYLKNMFFHVK